MPQKVCESMCTSGSGTIDVLTILKPFRKSGSENTANDGVNG